MQVFHSEATKLRRAKTELHDGQLMTPFECPERVDLVLEQIRQHEVGQVSEPQAFGRDPVDAVHDAAYVDFVANCWDDWQAAGYQGEAIPTTWPTRTMRDDRIPGHIGGKLGYYALGGDTSISQGSFEAAMASKDVALAAYRHTAASGEPSFGLCRPPGHHAATDQFGGYCFFNNAAIVAQHALSDGHGRVAILDVDFHHGNGTQQIFYARDDVLTQSIHGDPDQCFPYFLGHADERGEGRGLGFNVNYPLPPGTDYTTWCEQLELALGEIRRHQASLLVVSLGVDTFEGDPISSFRLKSDDFHDMGRRLASLELPTVILLEGGYAVKEIGINVVKVLKGFEQR
ncbi:histone deacetylase family protein [Halomonas denitrificans]|uniref:histone deacetylase family protein n=1 Tax=Halomonas TaxID=2745 RepID=UPI001C93BEE7|nr:MULTISPECIES: histone deacetylase family protein [Halomonas]MBY5984900.1 histone deacetylase family protein [Halomonas sp. DP5Y7-2]MBY6030586.1 histone deacetylase family protein [Halomonas sp. DP8Y7-1]MCA0976175.1 histone deacetylase family protein [Halomonas denitrificans]